MALTPQLSLQFGTQGSEGALLSWKDTPEKTEVQGGNAPAERADNAKAGPESSVNAISCAVFTTEYDVVACMDFKEDVGRWVRLMPEEIRRANPGFVPS